MIKFLNAFERKNKLYVKLLMMMTFSIILTIVIISAILYKNYEKFGLSMIHNYESEKLCQTSYSATYMKESANRLVMQLYVDRDIVKLMYNPTLDMLEVKASLDKLISYSATESFIHSIYIYNGKNNSFLTTLSTEGISNSNNFYDQEIVHILNNYDQYNILYPIPRKVPVPLMPIDEEHYSGVYTFIYYDTPKLNQPLESAIIVNVSEEWLRDMIKSMDINTVGEIFIINNQGQVVTGNHTYTMLADISDKDYINKVLDTTSDTGYFIEKIEGEKSVINYNTSKILGWKLISVTPYENMTQKINRMKHVTLLACLFILVLGIICSILMSHRLWKPIKNILNKMKTLEKQKRDSFNILKNRMLKAILKNDNSIIIENLENKFKEFKIQLKPELPTVIILLKIDHFANIKDKHNYKDREVLKFAIMNIASEICTDKYDHECIDMDADHVILVMNVYEHQRENLVISIKQLVKDVQSAMLQYFDVSLSAIISPIADDISYLYDTYNTTIKYSQYRFYFGHRCILYAEDMQKLEANDYEYPHKKEQQMVDAIMLGKLQNAIQLYEEIINEALNYSYYSMYQTLSRISLAISTVFDRIEKNYKGTLNFNFNISMVEMNNLETIEEVNKKFVGFFEEAIKGMLENKNSKHDQLIESIIEMIEKGYKDINLSVNTIADQLNITPNYLNRIFKKHTSVSVSQYINEIRIENIKIILETTARPINEIAEECGFANTSYFYTLFKKAYGITANEYRMKMKKD